jgi:energy-coupling factor transporter ATP-binding protein EcfA2
MQGLRVNVATIDDDTAAVTSFDFLSPDLDSVRPNGGEIGFIFRGKGISSALLERVGIGITERHMPIGGVYVTAFRIEGVRSISSLNWSIAGENAPGWHVLVGDNGSGKTTVLRAIALALIGTENVRALRQDWGTWLHDPHQVEANVEVELQHVNAAPRVAEPASRRTLRVTWTQTEDGAILSEESSGESSEEQKESLFSSGYGPFRRLTGGDVEFERQLVAFPKLARHLSLFDERAALTEGLAWLQELRFKSLENDGESMLLLNRTIGLVNECGLLPHGVRLSQVKSDAVKFRDELGREFNIEELSDGFRSILSLIFDIVRQLAVTYGAARVFDSANHEIINVPGVILIDEVDAHLHPSWQRVIGQWFRRHFPLIQFIVTTHSPLVCQAAEVGTVFRLPNPSDDFDSGGMLDGSALARLVYGNVLDAYASGAFGDDVTRSEASKEHLRRLAELNRKELMTALSHDEQIEQEGLRATFPSTAHTTVVEEH